MVIFEYCCAEETKHECYVFDYTFANCNEKDDPPGILWAGLCGLDTGSLLDSRHP